MAGGVRNIGLRIIASAVIGGTVSKVTGGKFANGATSAAFATLVTAGFNGELSNTSEASGSAIIDYSDEGTEAERKKRFEEISKEEIGVKFKDVYRGKQIDANGKVTYEEFDTQADFKKWMSLSTSSVKRTFINGDHRYRHAFGIKISDTITLYRTAVMGATATAYFPNGASDRTVLNYLDNGLRTLGHELAHRRGIELHKAGIHQKSNLEGLNYCKSRGGC